MARLQGRSTSVKRAALLLLIPIALVLTGCNVWPMYGGGPTHLNYDSSDVITTGDASTLVEVARPWPRPAQQLDHLVTHRGLKRHAVRHRQL